MDVALAHPVMISASSLLTETIPFPGGVPYIFSLNSLRFSFKFLLLFLYTQRLIHQW
jgi:hypothetical protein